MMYIIIDDKKLIIEIDTDTDLEDSEEYALDKIINEDPDSLEDIEDMKVGDLDFGQTYHLYSAYEIFRDIAGLDIDKLLIYWLKSRDINFKIEYDINIKEWQREGYVVISQG